MYYKHMITTAFLIDYNKNHYNVENPKYSYKNDNLTWVNMNIFIWIHSWII